MNKPTNEYIMAIKPEWVALIESKQKTLEIRRTAPYISPPVSVIDPIDVWVYETKGNGGRGQIVGRFLCCKIHTFDAHRDDLLLRRAARVPWEKLKEYQGDRTRLYAWEITCYKKLAVPLPLSALGCQFAPQSWCKRKKGEKSMKNRYFYGTIRPERATNEWQRKNALPERYATATPAEQARMREYYAVSDDECEEMRKIYATFPQHLVFMRSGVHQDEYVLVGWKKEQDEGVREAIWLLEQLGGAYEGYREKFLEDWAKEQYDPWGCWYIPECIMDIEGEYHPDDAKEQEGHDHEESNRA